jgi:arylsulfatase A-like enzyme
MRAVRTRGYKYIHNLSPAPVDLDLCDDFEWAHRVAQLPGQRCCVPRPSEELFDLSADPHEEHNLAAEPGAQDIKTELRAQLDAWRSRTNDPVK